MLFRSATPLLRQTVALMESSAALAPALAESCADALARLLVLIESVLQASPAAPAAGTPDLAPWSDVRTLLLDHLRRGDLRSNVVVRAHRATLVQQLGESLTGELEGLLARYDHEAALELLRVSGHT